MKFSTTETFRRDFNGLSPDHQRLFRAVIPEFNAACEAYAKDPGAAWPTALRVKPMRKFDGVWEATWSFTGPAGRATFEWIDIDGSLSVLWRRIGDHSIYGSP